MTQASLQRMLGRMFTPTKPRAPDLHRRDRETFKRLVAERGGVVHKSRDGYVEITPFDGFPKGVTTVHHGWDESLRRLRLVLADPMLVDDAGYYSE